VEIKSGYGLSVESEVATTSLAAEVTPESTFMGAHVVPTEYLGRADEYVDLVCGPMLEAVRPTSAGSTPSASAGHSTPTSRGRSSRRAAPPASVYASTPTSWITVPESASAWRWTARRWTIAPTSPTTTSRPSRQRTVATFLPAADFSTRQPYPDARRAIDAGVTVAIASNCNPGSSYTTSISFCIALAVRDMNMTIDEAIAAATTGGGAALRRKDVGRLAPAGPAHLTISTHRAATISPTGRAFR